MQSKLESLLEVQDITALFNDISRATLFRWLRDARQGKNNFPLPLNTPGRKLVWNKAAIENFINENQQVVNVPKTESTTQQRKRHATAMSELERKHGIKPRNRKDVR